jgi:hypothetical protein
MTARPRALGLLDVLVGQWTQQVSGHGDPIGTMTFEWTLGDRYLLQRSTLPAPFAESVALIEYDESAGEFRHHYFDNRGVSRVYRMTMAGPQWTLSRTEPDFSELKLAQRYVGTISDDGRSVAGQWEQSYDRGATWEPDFGVRLERRP